jgi:hypothetical protein
MNNGATFQTVDERLRKFTTSRMVDLSENSGLNWHGRIVASILHALEGEAVRGQTSELLSSSPTWPQSIKASLTPPRRNTAVIGEQRNVLALQDDR